ncbi:hypothetical protein [Dolichospermum circinale]|uniref:hypothetical protein n=1 Tax=Dolichospermum circinale TaxID=109265 RepID=UPI00232B8D0F|nr:hypothetical protein [Dolichospermum circinale]
MTPKPAIVATTHRGILPLPDTVFSSLTKIVSCQSSVVIRQLSVENFLPSVT